VAAACERRALPRLVQEWSRPLVIAHAGGAVLAGGDIHVGIDRAIDAGVKMIELDVRRTADGMLVVHHGGDPGISTLGARRSSDVVGPEIPTLEEALSWIGGRVAVNVELKEVGYEDAVVETCLQYVARDELLVTSFLDDAVKAVAALPTTVPRGLIIGRRSSLTRPERLLADVFPFARVRDCEADVLVAGRFLDLAGMRCRARRHRVPLIVWTINDPRTLTRALSDPRLLGVVTDRFDVAMR
jgi:glycerophosphoryl diester phosphodiesterase